MRLRALILLPFLLCLSLIAVKAQSSVTLQPGIPVDRTLGPDQVHEFTVNVKANSVVQLIVEQKGIDVVVKILSPDGKPFGEYDTPNGAGGFERVSFTAKEEGKYRVTISPLGGNEPTTGQYQIKLVEVREATEEEIESAKNRATAKAKGIALLLELRDAISQIKSIHTRISAQLLAASMLRENDEKAAAKYLSDALADLKEFLASADADADSENYMGQFSTISQLRDQMIRILAETDPDAALDFLHSTTPKYSPYGGDREMMVEESALELSIVDQIARRDPKRAVQIARQNLKKAYAPALLNTVTQLAEKNPELATELTHEIATRLLAEEKLIANAEAANFAIALVKSYRFFDQRIETRNGSMPVLVQTFPKGLVPEQDYKQLVQKMLREVLSYQPPQGRNYVGQGDAIWNLMSGLQSMGDELDKVVSGSSVAIHKKQSDLVGNVNPYINQFQDLQNAVANNSVEAALEAIEKGPPEIREQLYTQLATREANAGDINRARQILNEHIANPYQRAQAMRGIEQQEIDQALSSGKIEEALKNISTMRTPVERAQQLIQLAGKIGPGQKRATALSLLEQVRSLLPPSPQAQDQEQMGALFEIARAFSPYDSKRSFEIIDPLIDQFNDICTAARTLQGFGVEYFADDELYMQGEGSLAQLADQISNVLGDLALINFDRAKAASDKLRLPEVRLHVNLQIAAQAIGGGQKTQE